MKEDLKRFSGIGYEDFRRLAREPGLSRYERIGFPDSYRKGKEAYIFEDICRKLPLRDRTGLVVLDIGPGCSDLPRMLVDLCARQKHTLVLVDSAEMLELIEEGSGVEKHAALFPECPDLISRLKGKVDALLSYSVLHYNFEGTAAFGFLDASLSLLAPGGSLLLGDIPNISKRLRFFSSAAGVRFHQEFTGTSELPDLSFSGVENSQIDDAAILALLRRAREQGFDGYVVPQDPRLPMANRREDIFICRP